MTHTTSPHLVSDLPTHSGYQYAHEREMLWRTPCWVTDRPPPGPGTYMVSIAIEDNGTLMRSVRFDYFDGEYWRAGAYAVVEGWHEVPRAYDGVAKVSSTRIG